MIGSSDMGRGQGLAIREEITTYSEPGGITDATVKSPALYSLYIGWRSFPN